MHRALIVFMIAIAGFTGCHQSSSSSASSSKPADAVQQKLQELAGSGATDCGRLSMQAQARPDALKTASGCALQAAQNKRPFYVAYDLPGLTVAVAGSSQGQLYSFQSPQNPQPGATVEAKAVPCPAALRVAQSGRVTCFAPTSFGMGSTANPHAGIPMPPAVNSSHGGMSIPPAGTPNPHAGGKTTAPPPSKPTNPPPKQP